jgi:hypothetical protein
MPPASHGAIGGTFGLESKHSQVDIKELWSVGTGLTYFLNARCAIYALCQSIAPRTAWLPSYLCAAILEPFRKLRIPVRFYNDGPNFENTDSRWTGDIRQGDLVLLIHYFGFPNKTVPTTELISRGAVILEDAAQSLFVKQQYPNSVGIVYSPRKFFGVPDGGLAVSIRDVFRRNALQPPPENWWKDALAVAQIRREFDLAGGGENRWFPLFRQVEESHPLGLYRSSDLSRALIESGIDYQGLKRTRRDNYQTLASLLREHAVFPNLDEEVVPIGFPVRVNAHQRDKVLDFFYHRKIYPPVHWRIDGVVPEKYAESHLLSNSTLTLICDQRYSKDEMALEAETFVSAVTETS